MTKRCKPKEYSQTLRPLGVALAILLASLFLSFPSDAEEANEDQLKAVILLHFAELASWPAGAFSHDDGTLNLCLFGAGQIASYLAALGEDPVNNRRLSIKSPAGEKDIASCQMIYLGSHADLDEKQILASSEGKPALTFGDSERFIKNGGMVQLYEENHKIRLLIDLEKVTAAGIQISSRILALAKIVGKQ